MNKLTTVNKLYLLLFATLIYSLTIIFVSKEFFISLLALIISIISAFRNQIFPFQLETSFDTIVVGTTSGQSHDSLVLMLPIIFLNRAHGHGFIENLTIKVECGNSAKIYTPLFEIDFEKFIQFKRTFHAENISDFFMPFPLSGQCSIQKYILFSQVEDSKKYPFSSWDEGNYKFSIFLKHTHKSSTTLCSTQEHFISKEMLLGYKAGTTNVLISNRELDV